MVSTVLPMPVDSGGARRVFHVLKGLATEHSVTLATLSRPGSDAVALEQATGAQVVAVPWDWPGPLGKAAALTGSLPYHVQVYRSSALENRVRELLEREAFHLIYVHWLRSLGYVPADTEVPVILDQHHVDRDMWTLRARLGRNPLTRWLSERNRRKTVRFEDRWLPRVTAFVSVSEADRDSSRSYAQGAVRHFLVAPNGVDTEAFSPRGPTGNPEPVLGYLGSMDLDQNVDSVAYLHQEILPRVVAEVGRVKLLVIGKNPSRRLRSLPPKDGVDLQLTGTVADVRPFLDSVDVFTAPVLWGGGTKLKVLEAMARAVPVISNGHGLEGLGVTDGEHALRADSPADFSAAIVRLIRDSGAARQMGERGRAFVEANHSWSIITSRLRRDLDRIFHDEGAVGEAGD